MKKVLMIGVLLMVAGCSPNVLAGEMDLGFGFTVNPCKVEKSSGEVKITITNQTDTSKTFTIESATAELSVSLLTVDTNSAESFTVKVDKDRPTESRITVTEVTNTDIRHAMIIRVLKGGEEK